MTVIGRLILSGLDDDGLIILLEEKRKHRGFAFDPSTMKTKTPGHDEDRRTPARPYSNVTLGWEDDMGLKAVEAVLGKLHRHEEAKAAAAKGRS